MKLIYNLLGPSVVIAIAGCNNGAGLDNYVASAQNIVAQAATAKAAFVAADPTAAPAQTLKDAVTLLQDEIPVIETALKRLDNAGTVPESVPRLVEALKQAGAENQIMAAALDIPPAVPPRDDAAVQTEADAGDLPDLPSPPLPPRDDSDVPAAAPFTDAPVTPTVEAAAIEHVQTAQDQLQELSGEISEAGVIPVDPTIPPPPPPPTAEMLANVQHAKKEATKFDAAGEHNKADVTEIAAQNLAMDAATIDAGGTVTPAPTGNENTDLVGALAAAMNARRKAVDPVDAAEPGACEPDEWDEDALCQ